jgi:hypothetical protein
MVSLLNCFNIYGIYSMIVQDIWRMRKILTISKQAICLISICLSTWRMYKDVSMKAIRILMLTKFKVLCNYYYQGVMMMMINKMQSMLSNKLNAK